VVAWIVFGEQVNSGVPLHFRPTKTLNVGASEIPRNADIPNYSSEQVAAFPLSTILSFEQITRM